MPNLQPQDDTSIGRPTVYSDDIPEKVKGLCLLGMTDKEICKSIGIAESTFNVWKNKYPELMEAIYQGKDKADMSVVASLYERATGNGDSTKASDKAIQFWLTNRQRSRWTDNQDKQGLSVNVTINRGNTEIEVNGQTLDVEYD